MQVIFARRPTLGSWLLRLITWSRWSHCAVVTQEGSVIEASMQAGRVIERGLAAFRAEYPDVELCFADLPNDEAAVRWARAQVGRPYDWWGVIGLGLHRDWQDDAAWFCSELVEGAASAGGRCRFIRNPRRITPQHSWMVA